MTLIAPVFQAGKLSHGVGVGVGACTKFSNLPKMRVLCTANLGFRLEHKALQPSGGHSQQAAGRGALSALYYKVVALLLELREEPQPECKC